ncbi:N-acetylgalactosamine 6-sulfatase [Catenovulum maritimum]|uniref:N-acetylgalactosamine 6-sulfatase n=1 Tax=Catenovulum maritimum TaxID=1513271 RepID=A0A0J8GUI5_9ALTE|nr:N-acetylgalactosamine 6-sulfatase [Catenovulum maritimum]
MGCGDQNDQTASVNKTESNKQYNLIFIMADDMGYADLGSYGQEKIKTPNLDQMAAEGIRFTDFYAGTTVCAPSRSVLMTGLHMGHTPVRGNAGVKTQTLAPEDITVAEVLKDAGYKTALVGKWGLGDDGNTGLPNDQGFDYFFGYLNQVHAHNHYPEWLWRNKEKVMLDNIVELGPIAYMDFHGGVAKPENRKTYSSQLFFDEAVEYIDNAGKDPFFLFVSLTSPHANNEAEKFDWAHGMEVPESSYQEYADKDWKEPAKGYAAMVDFIDKGVGRILNKLKEKGLEDDTIVMFTSDNGPHEEGDNDPYFFDSNGPFQGTKRVLYDGGIRVPMIAWAPGTVPAGKTSNHVGYFGDLMATAADLAGVKTPEKLDSVSISPVLFGKDSEQQQHDFVYWEFYEMGGIQALRQGKWKAVRTPMFTGPVQIYDITKDLGEKNDLADQYPELAAKFDRLMNSSHTPDPRWVATTGAAGRH